MCVCAGVAVGKDPMVQPEHQEKGAMKGGKKVEKNKKQDRNVPLCHWACAVAIQPMHSKEERKKKTTKKTMKKRKKTE